ncbi:MAG: 16S rRNA (adenine(1518)-N(6)/adenine(1519)-N(6))-dimethyltransferase RsmA [Gammaproteobacteria bacterium]|nr:16S rRNA (adenine(1518)-N(6)/adenine(1519)-N(6))-dimethyltransferase RsmA [Gammaproteobacteria bacterium]
MSHRGKRCFGQHFLHEKAVLHHIIAAINPKTSEHFVEIGPGLGALTALLLPLAQSVDAIEIDRDLIPELINRCQNLGTLRVHAQDVLQFDFSALDIMPLRVVGNLPYNISTPLLFYLISYIDLIQDMHFMLQLEVAERIVASPGSKTYGRLSVMLQYFCEAELLFTVGPGAFTPPPKVDSAIVRLIPRLQEKRQLCDVAKLSEVVRLAFGQRRKTISNSLKKIISNESLLAIGIDPKLRPEQLSVAEFVQIAKN